MTQRPVRTALTALVAAATLLLAACVSGENSGSNRPVDNDNPVAGQVLDIDFATYNPLSLIIKDQGWLEAQGVQVNWVQSAGSNKANEALRAGAIDVGSTAGSAALLARSNGSPIRTVAIYSQPEWAALVAPRGSSITEVAQLRGKNVAATKGTDPYFFLLQALEANGLTAQDITVQNLQHADGWAALQNGSVDAWAGLDPIMAGAEQAGATLFYRDVNLNSYGFLNAQQDFVAEQPELAQLVVDSYAAAAQWAAANPDRTAEILADVAGIDLPVAQKVISERSNLDVDQVPGAAQIAVLEKIGPVFVDLGDVSTQQQVDDALATLVDDSFATKADPTRFPSAS